MDDPISYAKYGRKKYTGLPQLCACGCGHTVLTPDERGRRRRFISGHNSTGMKRGEGRYVNNFGYVMLRMPEHPDALGGYVREHRWVMEQYLGRRLEIAEHVHHRNRDKTDNRIENLELLGRRAHGKLHGHPVWDRRCSLPDCEQSHYGLGYCARHYQRFKSTGDPTAINLRSRRQIEQNEIQCGCGCGGVLETPDSRGRERRFIRGHNTRRDEQRAKMSAAVKRAWAERKARAAARVSSVLP